MNISRALLTGHFTTVGDIESLQIVQSWLNGSGINYDVAPFSESARRKMPKTRELGTIIPADYTHLIIICGPVWEEQLQELSFDISQFHHCIRIGINLTMVTPIHTWNPFDILLERDSDRLTRPDLTLLADTASAPVVGRCMVRKQSSYKGRERHDRARQLFDELIEKRDYAVIDIDTRWYRDQNGLRTPSHVLSALKRTDLLLTNRLHGMVYALKAGVPVIAIDAIEGGAKVSAQAKVIGWPQCIPIEEATPARLNAAVDWCLSPEAREVARACRDGALPALHDVKQQFLNALVTKVTTSPVQGNRVPTT